MNFNIRQILTFVLDRDANRLNVPFPTCFVINLDSRPDRWEAISARCSATGMNPVRLSAIRAAEGWIGCGRSHQECVRRAKELGLPWVLILEDDCEFDAQSIDHFRFLLPRLWQIRGSWDRFSGGPHFGDGPLSPDLSLVDNDFHLFSFCGLATHFDLINANAYDAVLDWDPQRDRPIDVFYLMAAKRENATVRSICSYPGIASQTVSPSDVTPRFASQMPYFAAFAQAQLLKHLEETAIMPADAVRLPARHPNWRGELVLSLHGNVVQHAATRSFGTYRVVDGDLLVRWYRYGEERFRPNGDELVHVAQPPPWREATE